MRLRCRLTCFTLLLAMAGPVHLTATGFENETGDVKLLGQNPSSARRLAPLQKHAASGELPEAVAEYIRLLENAGNDMAPLDNKHCIQLRWLAHRTLLNLPLSAVQLYRERTDEKMKRWSQEAESSRDELLLRRIVDEAFCSSYAGRALDLLGDIAFERGDLDEAEDWWQRIAPLYGGTSDHSLRLVLPDPKIDVARVRAKQALLPLLRGELSKFRDGLRVLESLHGEATGLFAGVHGRYAQTLQSLARAPNQLLNPTTQPPWGTFAGSPGRASIAREARISFSRPAWTVRVPELRGAERSNMPGAQSTLLTGSQVFPFYPTIARGQLFLSGPYSLIGYDMRSGRETGRYDVERRKEADGEAFVPGWENVSFTHTIDGNRAYVRLGAVAMRPPDGDQRDCEETCLVCLNLIPDHGRFPPLWQTRPQDVVAGPAMFEGSPTVFNGRVTIAVAIFSGVQVTTAIVCLDAETGTRLWTRKVCEASELKGEPRVRHYLLTAAAANIIYCTHSGAIVALDAMTGQHVWGLRYQSRGPLTAAGAPSPRDLAPCVWWRGRVFAAPVDYDRIMCVDGGTGELLWESQEIEVRHLLGVIEDRLVFAAGSWPRGIRAVECRSGRLFRSWYQPEEGQGDAASLGRGLLTRRDLFWPTSLGLRILRSEDAGQTQPRTITPEAVCPAAAISHSEKDAWRSRTRHSWASICMPGKPIFRKQAPARPVRRAGL